MPDCETCGHDPGTYYLLVLDQVSEAVAQGSVHALNYLVARDYVDALKSLAHSEHSRVVVLPLESGGITGSLAGIQRLAEAAAGTARPAAADAGDDAAPDPDLDDAETAPAAAKPEDLDELSWPEDETFGDDDTSLDDSEPA